MGMHEKIKVSVRGTVQRLKTTEELYTAEILVAAGGQRRAVTYTAPRRGEAIENALREAAGLLTDLTWQPAEQ